MWVETCKFRSILTQGRCINFHFCQWYVFTVFRSILQQCVLSYRLLNRVILASVASLYPPDWTGHFLSSCSTSARESPYPCCSRWFPVNPSEWIKANGICSIDDTCNDRLNSTIASLSFSYHQYNSTAYELPHCLWYARLKLSVAVRTGCPWLILSYVFGWWLSSRGSTRRQIGQGQLFRARLGRE